MTQKKIGFWAVLAIVIGSQVGSGIFLLPSTFAPYGYLSLAGWVISGIAAICLAMVFAFLCEKFPHTGGPHVYVNKVFGPHVAFFTGWAYWFVSWVSSTVIVIGAVGCLLPIIGNNSSPVFRLILEMILLGLVTVLNLKGVSTAGRVEFFLTLLKFLPLLILPIVAIFFFKGSNVHTSTEIASLSLSTVFARVAMLAMWGFLGLESGTTAAGSVENPAKTIPKALITATVCVAVLYILNSIGVMGLLPSDILSKSSVPYVDVVGYFFGKDCCFIVSIIFFFILVGTLNAWTLVSGQTILGLAEDGFMPKIFAKTNSNNSPCYGILAGSLGMAFILIFTANDSLGKQIEMIVGDSVAVFLLVYLICSLAALKIAIKNNAEISWFRWVSIIVSIIYCLWVIYTLPIRLIIIVSIFILSGLPIYLFWYLRKK